MKKNGLVFAVVALFLCLSFGSVVVGSNASKSDSYSHTVFVEAGTSSVCGPCGLAASYMKDIYSSGQYDFEYVALVIDKNDFASDRAFSLGVFSIPDYYFDGGFDSYVGTSGLPDGYVQHLDEAGAREVADLDVSVSAFCFEDFEYLIGITVEITNNEDVEYAGFLRGFVVEQQSRWQTSAGQKYSNAMVGDFALNQSIVIAAGQSVVVSAQWDGSEFGFDDLVSSNTLVLAAVYDATGPFGLVDESASVQPVITSNHAPSRPSVPVGPESGYVQAEYEFLSSSFDVDGNDIFYVFDWGDGSESGWLGPFSSGNTASASHVWAAAGSFEVRVRAKDVFGELSPWSESSFIVINENSAPGAPQISGPSQGKFGVEYTYNFSATDSDGNEVFFVIDWGDGSEVESGVVSSGEVVQLSHTWSVEDEFLLSAKAVDSFGAESEWITLPVSMPYSPGNSVFGFVLELFSALFEYFPVFGSFWALVV